MCGTAEEYSAAMKWLRRVLLGLVVFLLVASIGGAWYMSGLVLDGAEIKGDDASFDNAIVAITPAAGGATGTVTYRVPDRIKDPATDDNTVGRVGMRFEAGGYLLLDQGAKVDGTQVTRTYRLLEGTAPRAGDLGKMDWPAFPNAKALGLTQREVTYQSPFGTMPALIVDPVATAPKSTTWAVIIHGRNGSNREGLRITPRFAERGMTTMLINYRDDRKEPGIPAEDGLGNFGSTEWPDAQAAVAYALGAGAKHVVLVGYSMGGAITAAYLENGDNTAAVTGTVLVSPAVSFHDMTLFGAELKGIPTAPLAPVIWLAERFVELRTKIDYSTSEFKDNAATWPVPALVTAASKDDLVPPAAIEEFAKALPKGTYKYFEGAGHTGEWNKDSTTFDTLVNTWLDTQRVAQG
jgi:hypothetical protein